MMQAPLSPGALFSPSKARALTAQAKDWNYVDTWLSAKYAPKSAPPFERNADTLKALLALAAWNEAADEKRDLMGKLEVDALKDLQAEVRY
jgi:HAUS augmin-like complex subunit 1